MATTMAMEPIRNGPAAVATASGYIALLQESDTTLKSHALLKLLECVDTLWHEVAECLADLEGIAEDLDLPLEMRQRAAAVASRVFFHLEEPSQALRLALEAGEAHFDLHQKTPYVERLVAAALDAYIHERRKQLADEEDTTVLTGRGSKKGGKEQQPSEEEAGLPMDQLQRMVHRLLESCCADGKYDHALGIALEARETEKVRDVLVASGPDPTLLKYALNSSVKVVQSKAFRQEALDVIADCLQKQFETKLQSAAYDLILVHQLLGQPTPVSKVLTNLIQGTEEDSLLALQLCFDLMDSGDQAFVNGVADGMKEAQTADEGNDERKARWARTERVLTGGFPSELALSFLHKHSQADRLIMENLKKALEERGSGGRSSVLHNAAVITHSYLYAGTTNDSFLRDYLDWMKKASNWYVFPPILEPLP
jgi:26S proteasome regulatory subunit N2